MELTTAASTDAATCPEGPKEEEKRNASKHKMLIIDIINIPNTTHIIMTYGNIKSRLYCKNG